MMSRRERSIFVRYHQAFEAVPLPAEGSQSTIIAGLSGYAADMRGLKPALFAVKESFCYQEFVEAERILNRIECWVDERNAENWIPKSSRLRVYGGEEPVRSSGKEES